MFKIALISRVQSAFEPQSQFKVLMAIIRNEGILALWSGLIPTYLKAAPSIVLVYVLMEHLNAFYYKSTETPKNE